MANNFSITRKAGSGGTLFAGDSAMKNRMIVGIVLTLSVATVATGFFLPRDRSRPVTAMRTYSGVAKLSDAPDDLCDFSVTLDDLLYKLETAQAKYKLVRIAYSNRTANPIALSVDSDRIEAGIGDSLIAGSLNLQKADPTVWDALALSVRKAVVYPEMINPHKSARDSGYIYAWFPADKMNAIPNQFVFTVSKVAQPIVMKEQHHAGR